MGGRDRWRRKPLVRRRVRRARTGKLAAAGDPTGGGCRDMSPQGRGHNAEGLTELHRGRLRAEAGRGRTAAQVSTSALPAPPTALPDAAVFVAERGPHVAALDRTRQHPASPYWRTSVDGRRLASPRGIGTRYWTRGGLGASRRRAEARVARLRDEAAINIRALWLRQEGTAASLHAWRRYVDAILMAYGLVTPTGLAGGADPSRARPPSLRERFVRFGQAPVAIVEPRRPSFKPCSRRSTRRTSRCALDLFGRFARALRHRPRRSQAPSSAPSQRARYPARAPRATSVPPQRNPHFRLATSRTFSQLRFGDRRFAAAGRVASPARVGVVERTALPRCSTVLSELFRASEARLQSLRACATLLSRQRPGPRRSSSAPSRRPASKVCTRSSYLSSANALELAILPHDAARAPAPRAADAVAIQSPRSQLGCDTRSSLPAVELEGCRRAAQPRFRAFDSARRSSSSCSPSDNRRSRSTVPLGPRSAAGERRDPGSRRSDGPVIDSPERRPWSAAEALPFGDACQAARVVALFGHSSKSCPARQMRRKSAAWTPTMSARSQQPQAVRRKIRRKRAETGTMIALTRRPPAG